jgi:transketolase
MALDPLEEKWRAFNWAVLKVDGHDLSALAGAFAEARRVVDTPTAVVAYTVKGKGVPFMENKASWHGKAPTPSELVEARRTLYC